MSDVFKGYVEMVKCIFFKAVLRVYSKPLFTFSKVNKFIRHARAKKGNPLLIPQVIRFLAYSNKDD